MTYQCPVCQGALTLDAHSYCCAKGHRFDCAKEGYVNLLPVNKKKSKDPGDNKAMIFARRAFLSAGFYQHLSERINQLAEQWQPEASTILDLGCGEGYYSHRLFQSLTAEPRQLFGLDISRSAIRYAAKRYPELKFCVASAYEMPFVSNRFDLALRVYAPSKEAELARVMADKGILITVSPGPTHHYAIKELIYAHPRLHGDKGQELSGFVRVHQERLCSELVLPAGEMVGHFLEMTPYAWKLTAEQKGNLVANGLKCELDFLIEIHQKHNQM
ncbi:23S rRNA (guanine(745)-N(1))-methyltransferase [Shewanella sp. NFH-SH190041]|uniref:23S rRNA (guanine(745)-N(1))-methyltransferase n=1 Tax=Shewanella sp. NFH-SH190041 TaxID=2950245 RepID=UPI0021C400DC|nr:23S rRNA (guanine(745)-N(1))-methyltransferase [Shewanella sp. NFH-SH190041]BDM64531.1 23S rRNA (guanine(745)-N(1))-methyltransferase [Shewanella sp. NFH-SH190041]